MDWLGGWLKSIILVILLATFVDILLPNHSMQRYVKTVVSLFLLLTLLQPLLSIFQKQPSLEGLWAQADTLLQSKSGSTALPAFGPAPGAQAEMPTISSIQEHAERLKMFNQQQSEQIIRQQLGDLMKRDIEQSGEVTVTDIKVETEKDTGGQMQIRHVRVQAVPRNRQNDSQENAGGVKPVMVEPVKPVTIVIEPDTKSQLNRGTSGKDKAVSSAADSRRQTEIAMLLNKQWQVPIESVDVEISGGNDDKS